MSPNRAQPSDPATGPWHLDKRVPLAMISAILFQTGGMIWWASSIEQRVKLNTDTNLVQDIRLTRLDDARQTISERLTRIEQQTQDVAAGVNRIETKLDRIAK